MEFHGHSCVPGPVPPAGRQGRGVDTDLMSPCPQLAASELAPSPLLPITLTLPGGGGGRCCSHPGVGLDGDNQSGEPPALSLASQTVVCMPASWESCLKAASGSWVSAGDSSVIRGSPVTLVVLEGRSQSGGEQRKGCTRSCESGGS